MPDKRTPKIAPASVRVISAVCVCLMLALAGVQATHLHPASSAPDNHDCSVCSVLHSGAIATVAYQMAPLFARFIAPPAKDPSTETLFLVRSLYIRPPPAV